MNLQQILDLASINRNTFNSWGRKTTLRFLGERLAGEGRNRFTISHAAALACVSRFLQMGVDVRRAESVVSELFANLDDRVQSGVAEPTWLSYYMDGPYMYGFSFNYGDVNNQRDLSEGKIVAAEDATGTEFQGGATIRYSVDLYQIMQALNARSADGEAA